MSRVSPLIFQPIFKPKIWGGRRLETVVDKKLDTTEPVGESWELVDLENGQSVVRGGPAKGRTLGELVRAWGADLLGHAPLFEGRFPLLIKFLDANENLAVDHLLDLRRDIMKGVAQAFYPEGIAGPFDNISELAHHQLS